MGGMSVHESLACSLDSDSCIRYEGDVAAGRRHRIPGLAAALAARWHIAMASLRRAVQIALLDAHLSEVCEMRTIESAQPVASGAPRPWAALR